MLLCTRVITGERLAAFIHPIFEDAFQDFNASDLLGGSLPNRKSKHPDSLTLYVGELRT
jgi:hypothetical protein